MQSFLSVHEADVKGVISGFDRVRFRGTLRFLANVRGLLVFLRSAGILLKDFADWAMDLTEEIRRTTERKAHDLDRKLVYLESCHTNKEETALKIAQDEGITEGLICVLSCVEPGTSFKVCPNKELKKVELKQFWGKCLHYYFYILDPRLGLVNFRLQTHVPFTIHMNINGREWLARQLMAEQIPFTKRDNCFVDLGDIPRAQALLDEQLCTNWSELLGGFVREWHPVHALRLSQIPYYFSADTTEVATDVMFRSKEALARVYPDMVRHSVQDMGCADVLHFLGRRGTIQQCLGADVKSSVLTRHEGTRCKHSINSNSIKMYDKQESVLRIETTINDPRDMKAFRTKEGRQGEDSKEEDGKEQKPEWLRMRKGVCDLARRSMVSQAANSRYLESLASVKHAVSLGETLQDLCKPAKLGGRRVRAMKPFDEQDTELLKAVSHGEFAINGFRNKDLQALIPRRMSVPAGSDGPTAPATDRQHAARISRLLRLLRAHHLVRKVSKTHRYLLTSSGITIITSILKAQQATTEKLAQLAL